MPTYYATDSIPFAPAVKIKPIGRFWCPHWQTWRVRGRVTSRIDWPGRRRGDILDCRPSGLYAFQGVQRGKCGRLYWADRMPDVEFMALPIVEA